MSTPTPTVPDSQQTLVDDRVLDRTPNGARILVHATPESGPMEDIPVASDDEDTTVANGSSPVHPPGLPIPPHLLLQTLSPEELQQYVANVTIPPPSNQLQPHTTAPPMTNMPATQIHPPPPLLGNPLLAQWQTPVPVHVPLPLQREALADVNVNIQTEMQGRQDVEGMRAQILQAILEDKDVRTDTSTGSFSPTQNPPSATTSPLPPSSLESSITPRPDDSSPRDLDLNIPHLVRLYKGDEGDAGENTGPTKLERRALAEDEHLKQQDEATQPRNQNPLTQSQTYRGEHLADAPVLNSARNNKKRSWAGSPHPEDMQRRLSRLRMTGTTPALRSLRALPRSPSSASNPWDSEQRRRGDYVDVGNTFLPVASSTPSATTVLPDDQTPPPFVNTSGQPPTPHYVDDSGESPTRMESMSRHASSTEQRVHRQEHHHPMEVDPESGRDDDESPDPRSPVRPARGKGKARATTVEDEENDPQLGNACDAEWDEEDMLRARQQSLRQALDDRARLTYGEGYGSYVGFADPRTSGTRGSQTLGPATAGPSGRRSLGEEPRTSLGFETREWRVPTGGPTNTRMGSMERHRERSEYRPFPNTRAAEYAGRNGASGRTNDYDRGALMQRSPPTRVAGLSGTAPRHANTDRGAGSAGTGRNHTLPDHAIHSRRTGSTREARNTDARRAHQSPTDGMDEDEDVAREDDENDPWCQVEDGEVIPTAIEAGFTNSDEPTDLPTGGFPRIHREDPEARIRGMAVEWIQEIWTDPPHSSFLLDVFNYRYTEDETYNRRISERLRNRVEQATGDSNFDVVPPEADPRLNARSRDLPTTWAIRGLSAAGVANALRRGVWSFHDISFFAFPRAAERTSWICMLEGFLDGNATKIRAAVLRALAEEDMRAWLEAMVETNTEFQGTSVADGVRAIIASVRVEPMRMGNGNFVANIFIRSPTRDIREWRRWAENLRARRYRTFANGTGRVRHTTRCSGCHGVSHPTHICPFPRLRGWNGPRQGDGVFGERSGAEDESSPGVDDAGYGRRQTQNRDDRNRGRGGGSTPNPRGGRGGYNGGPNRGRGGGPNRGHGASGPSRARRF
ncbi:hypothetical protein C8T65DRAFT_701508 [Cerioporus squamosus]|nr:hypothetical protein C8T65DRAFT_701508 [Cerioporus squamosus]